MVADCYARTYKTQSILTASPGQLVLMLYDGALRFLGIAHAALETGVRDPRCIETIHTNIIKAQNILAELRGGLDHAAGGELATTLDRLYDYYTRRLFEANLKKNLAPLSEVEHLLTELRNAWAEMLRTGGADRSAIAQAESIA